MLFLEAKGRKISRRRGEVEDRGETCGFSICEDHAGFRESCFSKVVGGGATQSTLDCGVLSFFFFKVSEI